MNRMVLVLWRYLKYLQCKIHLCNDITRQNIVIAMIQLMETAIVLEDLTHHQLYRDEGTTFISAIARIAFYILPFKAFRVEVYLIWL